MFLQRIKEKNFEIATRVFFEPERNIQEVGLVIYENRDNYVLLSRAYCNFSDCVGNGLYFDHVYFGHWIQPNYATEISNPAEVNLRLRWVGNTYMAYYSEDGLIWTRLGNHTSLIEPVSYGLLIGQSDQPISADFDYFELYTIP